MPQQTDDQQPRCDCCGEFLGPGHVAARETRNSLREAVVYLDSLLTQIDGVALEWEKWAEHNEVGGA